VRIERFAHGLLSRFNIGRYPSTHCMALAIDEDKRLGIN
jgi:hypothetical protein